METIGSILFPCVPTIHLFINVTLYIVLTYTVVSREDNTLEVSPKAFDAIGVNIVSPNKLTLAMINKEMVVKIFQV
jgi:hypothetical protein